jgi:hypothetical protein
MSICLKWGDKLLLLLLLLAPYTITLVFRPTYRRSEQYGSHKGYVTVVFMIVLILPLATEGWAKVPQIIQLSLLLQA